MLYYVSLEGLDVLYKIGAAFNIRICYIDILVSLTAIKLYGTYVVYAYYSSIKFYNEFGYTWYA